MKESLLSFEKVSWSSEALVTIGPPAVPALVDALDERTPSIPKLIEETILRICTGHRAKEAVPFLVSCVTDRRRASHRRVSAVRILGVIGAISDGVAPALTQAVRDPSDDELRTAAAEALWRIQAEEADEAASDDHVPH